MDSQYFRQRLARSFAAGHLDEAAATLQLWRLQAGNSFETEFHAIQLHMLSGNFRAAMQAALRLRPTVECPPSLLMEVVACLRQFAAHDLLVEWGQTYPHRALVPPRDAATVSVDFSAVGAHELALTWITGAAERAPEDVVCRMNRALILTYLGRFGAARVDLDWAVKQPQSRAMAHWHLARLTRQTSRENRILAIRRALQSSTDAGDVAFLAHALFKTYDDLGEYAAAWQALDQSCRAARKRRPYDRQLTETRFATIKETFGQVQAPTVGAVHGAEEIPVFIVGMHRSGTSLIERMLGASDSVRTLGETNRLDVSLRHAAEYGGLGELDGDTLRRAATADSVEIRRVFAMLHSNLAKGCRFQTEKSPGNFLHVGFIRSAMPEARVIHMRREPVDLCFANLRELFGHGVTHSYAMDDLVHYHQLYADLMAHWHRTCPGFILDVDYESLVRDPVNESKRVFEFCGIEWSENVVAIETRIDAPVSTLSSIQVRQPVYAASVGRWRPYAPWLQTLCKGLSPVTSFE